MPPDTLHCLYRESLTENKSLYKAEISTQLGMLEKCRELSPTQPTSEALAPASKAAVKPQPKDQKYEKVKEVLQVLMDLHSDTLITDEVYKLQQQDTLTLYRSS